MNEIKMNISKKIAELISMYTDVSSDKIADDTALRPLGIDSLALANIIAAIEDEFDISINIKDHKFPPTFSTSDMVNIILKLQGKELSEEALEKDPLPGESSSSNNSSKESLNEVKTFNNLKEMLDETATKFPDRPAHWIRKEAGGELEPVTYKEFKHLVDSAGTAFLDMGLSGDKIGVIGDNSMDWKVAYLATVNGGNCIVPLDKQLPEKELKRLIQRSGIKAIVFTDVTQTGINIKQSLMNIASETDTIEHYISMSGADPENNILGFQDVISKGETLLESGDRSFLDAEIDNDKMSMIKFTSRYY